MMSIYLHKSKQYILLYTNHKIKKYILLYTNHNYFFKKYSDLIFYALKILFFTLSVR